MGLFSALTGSSELVVNAEEALQLVKEGAQLLDVREAFERQINRAKGDIHIPLGQVATSGPRRLSKNKKVVVYCASGMRSRSAAKTLKQAGFDAYSLKGGLPSWANAGGQLA